MKKDISINNSIKPIIGFFRRFHGIIYFLVVSTCLFVAIFTLLPITSLSTEESRTSGQTVDGSLDQATIDRLRNGTASGSAYQPGERQSPFNE